MTTLIGINVTDSWKLAMYHGTINFSKKDPQKMMTATRLAGVFGWQLLKHASFRSLPTLSSHFAKTSVGCPTISVSVPHSVGNLSSITGSDIPEDIVPICSIADSKRKKDPP